MSKFLVCIMYINLYFYFSEETPYCAPWSQQASTTEWRPGCLAAIWDCHRCCHICRHPLRDGNPLTPANRTSPRTWWTSSPWTSCHTPLWRVRLSALYFAGQNPHSWCLVVNTSPTNSYLIQLQMSWGRLPNNSTQWMTSVSQWTYGAAGIWGHL